MNEVMLAGFIPQGSEWLLILLVVLLLFGGSKLPQLAKALGQSKRAFREGQDHADEEARLEEANRREKLRSADTAELEAELRAREKSASDKR